MPEFTTTDWYRFPFYYDVVFGPDTPKEADFLEAVWERHGPRRRRKSLRMFEPACGSGRLGFELAHRGHQVAGFDISREMLDYANDLASREAAAVRRRLRFDHDRMESFRRPGPFDMGFCLLSTFKYLLTERHARAHLRRVAQVLVPGGLYVLGLHLTDYARRRTDREVWRGEQDGVRVLCETITRPADATTRLEALRNRLEIRRPGERRVERLETNWHCRTYNAEEIETLLIRFPDLEPVACYDFAHDIDSPRALDDTQEDVVIVLRRRFKR